MREVEAEFVSAAKEIMPWQLVRYARRLRHVVDSEGELDDANAAFDRRAVRLSGPTMDGVWLLAGELDAVGGEMLNRALTALMPPPGPDDQRRPWQRRADALVELAERLLQSGELPSSHGVRPHITLTVSAAELRGEKGAAGGELDSGFVVPTATALRLTCDATVATVVVDEDGRPIAAGRARRTIPAPTRRALVARDRTCTAVGCDMPPEWTDGHHIHHWARGGDHEVANLRLLCRRHHRLAHEEEERQRLRE